MKRFNILVRIGLTSNHWFSNQKEVAEWLGIKNCSKKALERRCNKLNFHLEFFN